MATYEYVCLACERPFEERRPMTSGPGSATVTALACPVCGSDRVRRRFSFATTGTASSSPSAGAGCACGGACACGH